MALLALVSPGGAPGATTTALALTLAWPEQVLMAECDPDGGSVLTGLFAGHFPADRGLLHLALRIKEDPADAEAALAQQVLPLDEAGSRPVLPGPADPFQAQAVTADTWEQIAAMLADYPGDVIADVGQVRATGYPFPILGAASLITVVLRPTLRQVHAARSRVAAIRQSLGEHVPVALCVIGQGPHSVPEITSALGGAFAAAVQLPFDARTAARLSDGATRRRRDIRSSDLLLQARGSVRKLHAALHADRLPGASPSQMAPVGERGRR
ncbi:hypothetical protein [Actinomadura sp. SCN-SB]|uniref:hypothetical protein n=1 Tax=Actinomadura sp. SCN-SB TaxID=3373092 RepID=UPI00374FEB4B